MINCYLCQTPLSFLYQDQGTQFFACHNVSCSDNYSQSSDYTYRHGKWLFWWKNDGDFTYRFNFIPNNYYPFQSIIYPKNQELILMYPSQNQISMKTIRFPIHLSFTSCSSQEFQHALDRIFKLLNFM